MPYVDKRGKPLYEYETLPNGRKKVTLTLVDGDKEWDGDGLKNGRIVDPGMIAEIIETENDTNEVGISYSWQSSSDGISWEEIGTNETYEITENEYSIFCDQNNLHYLNEKIIEKYGQTNC